MTAAAMKGDRERCLEAGMDGYIAKPIEAEQLYQTLAEYAAAASQDTTESKIDEHRVPEPITAADNPVAEAIPESETWDIQAACRHIPGGQDAVGDMARLFLSESTTMLQEMRDGITAGDAAAIERNAHTLKGSAQLFAADRVVSLARQIEEMGRERELENVVAAFESLQQEVARLNSSLQTYLGIP
jgi:HPt (histidine-containing phosphotransfer) domain-containing protein